MADEAFCLKSAPVDVPGFVVPSFVGSPVHDMMHDEEAAGTRCPAMEIEPEKFRPQYIVQNFFRVGGRVKTRVGRVSGNRKFFRPH